MAIDVQSPSEPSATAQRNGAIANDVHSPPDRSITTLVGGIIADAQQLIQQQFTMFRQEVRDDFRKTKEAALSLAVGVTISLAGSVLLLVMLPLLLHWAVPELALWACFGIVAGVLAALGGVLAYRGVKKFQSFNPLPDQSADAFMENLQWKTNPK
jgi:Putative Actinobacterial Holin-X, holin superfamily III